MYVVYGQTKSRFLFFNHHHGITKFLIIDADKDPRAPARTTYTIEPLFQKIKYKMDNDAFQALVRNRTLGKSTKQIAREAVEDEHQRNQKKRKRKRGGGGGDDDSSEEEEEEDHSRRPKNQQEDDFRRLVPRSVSAAATSQEEEEEEVYRDRAKERREGKHNGDDERETADYDIVPKKGLDLNLARKVKKSMQKTEDDKDSSIQPIVANAAVSSSSMSSSLPTLEEAKTVLQNFVEESSSTIQISSALSGYLFQFVETKSIQKKSANMIKCGLAGRTIQRSRLALSLNGHPSDLARSWEQPREITHPNTGNNLDPYNKPRLDAQVIAQISRVLPGPKYVSIGSWKTEVLPFKTENNDTTVQAKSIDNKDTNAVEQDDNSDEDIFGGLENYAPPAPSKATT